MDVFAKRRKKILKTVDEPIMPKFCRLMLRLMLLVTGVSVLTDVATAARYSGFAGARRMMANASVSAFYSWLLFSAVIIPLSIWQLMKLRGEQPDAADKDVEDGFARRRELDKKLFADCAIVAGAGLAATGLLFLMFR